MSKILSEIEQNFYGVDLHVHTPASSCYKGDKSDLEYLRILERYKNKKIKVLAITDHNTIRGYKKLLNIKEELKSKSQVLKEILDEKPELSKLEDFNNKYVEINERLSIFEEIYILPGIEFEAKPGIHLLLLFEPNSNLNKVEEFLRESGYSDELQGDESPDSISSYDVIDLLEKSKDINAIAIAAHVDSNKGIYNDLSGTYRSHVFKHKQLLAISYNNPLTCQSIKQMMNNKEYRREHPIAYIQCSDYHGDSDEPGRRITYLKLDNICFEEIIKALKNPNECVSPTQHPKVTNILRGIISDPKTLSFLNFDDKDLIKKSACALLNSAYGTIVIGVSNKTEIDIVGIKLDINQINENIKDIMLDIKPKKYEYRVRIHSFGSDRNVLVLSLYALNKTELFSLDGINVYILRDKSVIKANTQDIKDIVENKLFNRILDFQRINQKKFDVIVNEITLLRDMTSKITTINKIEKSSINIGNIMETSFINPYIGKLDFNDDKLVNGQSTGRLYYTKKTEPRLNNAILRYSCPRTNEYDNEEFDVDMYREDALIIAPGGGTFLVQNKMDWGIVSLDEEEYTMVLKINNKKKGLFSYLSILAWLKSSLMLWYCYEALGNLNYNLPEIYYGLPIPLINIMKPGNIIESYVLEILENEKVYLDNSQKALIEDKKKYTEETIKYINDITDEHNKQTDIIAKKIDRIFIKELNIDKTEEDMINRFFDIKGIHNILNNNIC